MKKLMVIFILISFFLLLSGAAYTANVPETISIGNVKLERIHHNEHLLPDIEHAGFSSLLFDTDGRLVLDNGQAWLYTTGLYEPPTGGLRDWYGKWVSHVRKFNPKTLVSGEKKLALGLAPEDKWAVIHHAIKVNYDLYVVFYSTNKGVRAAVSEKPDGNFFTVPDFEITVTEPWEKELGEKHSLESCGGHVKIEENENEFIFWLIYDSYHVDATAGQLGWVKVRLDKQSKYLELLEKHPENPLDLLPEGYIAARAGGNVASDVILDGKHTLFFYTRPDKENIFLTIALASDELFQNIEEQAVIEGPLGNEVVIEKFEAYMIDDILYVIYENKLSNNRWGTGIRLYKVTDE